MATIQKPIRPGTVIEFVGESLPRILPSFADVVAVGIVHHDGPVLEPTLVTNVLQFDETFGNDDSPGRRAVILALNGQGAGVGTGAGGVLVTRAAGASAARSSITISNTAPAPALRLQAKHPGTGGDRISHTVAADPDIPGNDRLTLFKDGVRKERFSYVATDIAALGADVNARSNLVDADGPAGGAIVTGTALTVTNPADPDGPNLTGGDSGLTLTGAEHTAMQVALEFKRFSVIALYDLTDETITGTWVAWVRQQATAMRPVILITGGGSADTIATAIARSAAANDPHVVNLGVGRYFDDLLERELTTSELAPRVAGILVARGITKALTFARVGGLHAVGQTGPDNADIEDAIEGGVTVFSHATSAVAELQIEMGLTTFTSIADPARPRDVFSDPRLIRIMDLYIRGMKEWGDENVIGGPVNQDQRDAVRAEARNRQDVLEESGLTIPATSFVNVPVPEDPALADAIPYDFGWQFARTANYVLGNGRIR